MKDVEIYPSSWYYNACVHGFLEVLAWGLGDRGIDIVEEQFLQNDGSVRIPGELMEAIFSTQDVPAPNGYELREVPDDVRDLKRIAWWWVELSSKVKDDEPKVVVELTRRSMFGSNKTFYPNLLPHNQNTATIDFLNNWFTFGNGNDLYCSFCNMTCNFDENQASKMFFFSSSVSKYLGSSLEQVPNLYWDTQPSIIMCSLCRSYMLFFHLIHSRRVYVNSDLIIINWHLNHLLNQRNKMGTKIQSTFFNALHYDHQMRNILGSWGLQKLELVRMEWNNITVQPITEKLSTLLLIPEIGNSLNRFNGTQVWDLFIEERFDHFLILAYKNLRFFITGENKNNDPEILSNNNNRTATLANNLVKLFYLIKKVEIKGGKGMESVNFKEIEIAAKNSPLKITDNADKGVIFRLLELTRLNKKNEVYHLLLRTYIARGEQFPDSLAKIFSLYNEQLLQTGIYSYIAGLEEKNKNYANGEES